MGWFNFNNNTQLDNAAEYEVRVESIQSNEINASRLEGLQFSSGDSPLVIAFVSPNIDFESTMQQLKTAMPFAKKVIGVMTAGELSSCDNSLYHSTNE